jgi:hypothetical protein
MGPAAQGSSAAQESGSSLPASHRPKLSRKQPTTQSSATPQTLPGGVLPGENQGMPEVPSQYTGWGPLAPLPKQMPKRPPPGGLTWVEQQRYGYPQAEDLQAQGIPGVPPQPHAYWVGEQKPTQLTWKTEHPGEPSQSHPGQDNPVVPPQPYEVTWAEDNLASPGRRVSTAKPPVRDAARARRKGPRTSSSQAEGNQGVDNA